MQEANFNKKEIKELLRQIGKERLQEACDKGEFAYEFLPMPMRMDDLYLTRDSRNTYLVRWFPLTRLKIMIVDEWEDYIPKEEWVNDAWNYPKPIKK